MANEAFFCANCYEATHDVTKSVVILNTFGYCSHCGSDQVTSAETMIPSLKSTAARVKQELPPTPRRNLPYNTDLLRQSEIRQWLVTQGCTKEETWWDGTYFEYHLWFLITISDEPSFELLLENSNGEQKNLTWRINGWSLEPEAKASLSVSPESQ